MSDDKPPHGQLVFTMNICLRMSGCSHHEHGYKSYARRWEIWNKFGDIATIIGKALLSGRIWVAIPNTMVSRGKHNGDATSTYHNSFQHVTQNNGWSVTAPNWAKPAHARMAKLFGTDVQLGTAFILDLDGSVPVCSSSP